MKITKKFLREKEACSEGVKWFLSQKETDGLKVVKKLIAENQLDWANWLIVRIMEYRDYVAYAVFAAEHVIGHYEKQYPGDARPRLAIEAAKKCLQNPSEKNKKAADAAADAAYAAYAASAADSAASAASAADAAYAAYAAYAAAAAYAADAEMKIKILEYGIKLFEDKSKK